MVRGNQERYEKLKVMKQDIYQRVKLRNKFQVGTFTEEQKREACSRERSLTQSERIKE